MAHEHRHDHEHEHHHPHEHEHYQQHTQSHSHHGHHHHHGAITNIKAAFIINTLFAFIEIGGGIYTNSLAIISNALHDLGDSLSLGLAWYFQNLSEKKRDRNFSYGYGRFSLLGAIINSIVLTVGSVIILREAIPRIWNPEVSDAKGMIIMSVLGILFNAAALLRLRRGDTMNEKVVSLHFLEDILSWVAVLVGSIILHYTGILWIDPVLSIFISLFILYNVVGNIRSSLKIFLQGIPGDLQMERIENDIRTMQGVTSLHDVHLWTLDGQYNILSLHVVVNNLVQMEEAEKLKRDIRSLLKDSSIQHVTLEIEMEDQECELEEH